ncbi:MAG: ribosome maturation factor RimM [Pseudonocardia sp.]|uniref:ribosome maturation factor RimM n=1 Tax=unclassified Pseudonocardia TaxID=2619320 RepID=UPI0008686B1E|nr:MULTISPECIES: ribosome maturation factor RimM [unclassified Pseudonocardia]MBN9111053.1 ribosome maturation factor RimM [Pseudonocardia sp.]ODV05086.1 MAG: ribosome maturation factor RimM [Pseudonocardia sp. SCN 73-27]
MSSTPTGSTAPGPTRLLVGVVVRPHGLRGELVVEVRTDSPEERFAPGAELVALSGVRSTGAPVPATLTVVSSRPHSGRLLVMFAEAADRDAAEALRGIRLLVDAADLPPTGDPDEFHAHQLEGLRAELGDGTVVGTVKEIAHGPGGELLVLTRPDLPDALVPFVTEIVPVVDLDGGRVVLDPPEGLLDP